LTSLVIEIRLSISHYKNENTIPIYRLHSLSTTEYWYLLFTVRVTATVYIVHNYTYCSANTWHG